MRKKEERAGMQRRGITGALGTAQLLGLARQRVLENSAALQVHVNVHTPTPPHTWGLLTHCLSQNSPRSTLLLPLICGNRDQPE